MNYKKIYEAARLDPSYKAAKERLKKPYQKYVHELKVNENNQVDALSFQNFISEQAGRKINFHTDKGKMFWELTEEELNDDIECTCIGYRMTAIIQKKKDLIHLVGIKM